MFKKINLHLHASIQLLLAVLLVGFSLSLQAQVEIHMNAYTDGKVVAISYHPTDSSVFLQQLQAGYQLRRTEVDASGNAIGSTTLLSKQLLPYTAEWFNTNQNAFGGLAQPIAALLYDTTYQFEENELLNEAGVKFNYLAYESIRSAVVAEALGLGYIDKAVADGKRYKYTVSANGTNYEQSIIVEMGETIFKRSPENTYHEFRFQNGRSLSAMRDEGKQEPAYAIRLTSKPYGDSIVLRWVVTSPRLWEAVKKDGFKLYRTKEDGSNAAKELIAEVMPVKEENLPQRILEDTSAMIAASILHDNVENATPPPGATFQGAVMMNNLFGILLWSADQSALAAEILGLRYTDKNVDPGMRYSYMITSETVSDPFSKGYSIVVNEPIEEAAPTGFQVLAGDEELMLVWDKFGANERFSSYQLERSEDKVSYVSLNKAPILIAESNELPLDDFRQRDTTVDNNKTFYYRLKGKNAFGEWSPYAEVEATALDFTPPVPPEITTAEFDEQLKQFSFSWTDTQAQQDDLKSYQLMLSDNPKGNFSAVSEILSKDQFSYTLDVGDLDTDRGFYFRLDAQDERGNLASSNVKSVIVPDKVAPDSPTELTGYIDTAGIVRMEWKDSEAKDVTGYWIYWSNFPDEVMVKANAERLLVTEFAWEVKLESLNERMYVCVRAQDDSYNLSEPSEIVEVRRPDFVPPLPPIAKAVDPVEEGLEIRWVPGTSPDTEMQVIFKRERKGAGTAFSVLDTVPPNATKYIDRDIEIGQNYDYALYAIDDARLYSERSAVVFGYKPFDPASAVVANFEANLDTKEGSAAQLNWSFEPTLPHLKKQYYEFHIYRSKASGNPQFYKSIDADQESFTDFDLQSNVLYNYSVRVRFDNGWIGDLSEVQSLLIEQN